MAEASLAGSVGRCPQVGQLEQAKGKGDSQFMTDFRDDVCGLGERSEAAAGRRSGGHNGEEPSARLELGGTDAPGVRAPDQLQLTPGR